MPAQEALLRGVGNVKQSLKNKHYQVELGNEPNNKPVTLARLDCIPTLAHGNEKQTWE